MLSFNQFEQVLKEALKGGYELTPLKDSDLARYAMPDGQEEKVMQQQSQIQDMELSNNFGGDTKRLPDSFEVGVRADYNYTPPKFMRSEEAMTAGSEPGNAIAPEDNGLVDDDAGTVKPVPASTKADKIFGVKKRPKRRQNSDD